LQFVLAWAELHQGEPLEDWRWLAPVRHFSRSKRSDDWTDPEITVAFVVNHGVLRLTFADGVTSEVAVLERMRGPVFVEARTPAGFVAAAVDVETGTVVWPGGADLAPDTLYERIRTGIWPDQSVAA